MNWLMPSSKTDAVMALVRVAANDGVDGWIIGAWKAKAETATASMVDSLRSDERVPRCRQTRVTERGRQRCSGGPA